MLDKSGEMPGYGLPKPAFKEWRIIHNEIYFIAPWFSINSRLTFFKGVVLWIGMHWQKEF